MMGVLSLSTIPFYVVAMILGTLMTVLHVGILFYGILTGLLIKLTISVLAPTIMHLLIMPDAQTIYIMWVKVMSSRMQ